MHDMKRIINWLLTLFLGTLLGFLAERFVFGRSAQEKIISLKAELNAMRGQLRGVEQKSLEKSAEILTLQSKLNNYSQQLAVAQAEATQLRHELSSTRAIAEVTDLNMLEGIEMSDVYLSDNLTDAEDADIRPPVEEIVVVSLVEDGEPFAVGVETDELEVQSAESDEIPLPPESVEPAEITDMLQKIEGIGPKSEEALIAAGVTTFSQIALMSVDDLGQIISDAGMRRLASIETWSEQAALAAAGEWDALQTLQDELDGGRRMG